MGLSSYKLYGGNKATNTKNHTVSLYDSLADVQNQGYKFINNGQILYAKYGELTDNKASKFRVKIGGSTKALLVEATTKVILVDRFTNTRQIPVPSKRDTDPNSANSQGWSSGYNTRVSVSDNLATMRYEYTPPKTTIPIIAYDLRRFPKNAKFTLTFKMSDLNKALVKVYSSKDTSNGAIGALWGEMSEIYTYSDSISTIASVTFNYTDFVFIELDSTSSKSNYSSVVISDLSLIYEY